jgi:hypothetical protein
MVKIIKIIIKRVMWERPVLLLAMLAIVRVTRNLTLKTKGSFAVSVEKRIVKLDHCTCVVMALLVVTCIVAIVSAISVLTLY